MTPLRKRMIDDLRIRNRSPRTIEAYVRSVAQFAAFHRHSPVELGPEHVRLYQIHLLEQKVSWAKFNLTVCAVRFLYRVTLQRDWPLERLPYGKKPKRLPVVLSQQEVLRFLGAVQPLSSRMALATAYASGLRVSEVAALRVQDIDSARMLIHVIGKGDKERIVPLSEVLLDALRTYWRQRRPTKPWLFPGRGEGKPIGVKTIQSACVRARKAAGFSSKRVTAHSMRHNAESRIMPSQSLIARSLPANYGHEGRDCSA